MKESPKYVKMVVWSDEDQCFKLMGNVVIGKSQIRILTR